MNFWEEGNDEPLTLEKEELADISADIDSKSSVVNEETPENKSTISESSEITDEDTKNHDVEQTQSKHEDETSEPSDNSDQESNPEDATNAINSDADSESIEDDIVVETEPQGTVHISAYNPGHSEPKPLHWE